VEQSIWLRQEEREFEKQYYHENRVAEIKELRYLKRIREKRVRETRFSARQLKIAEYYKQCDTADKNKTDYGHPANQKQSKGSEFAMRYYMLKQTPARTEATHEMDSKYDDKLSERKRKEFARSSSPSRESSCENSSRGIEYRAENAEQLSQSENAQNRQYKLLLSVLERNAQKISKIKTMHESVGDSGSVLPPGFATPKKAAMRRPLGEDDLTPRKGIAPQKNLIDSRSYQTNTMPSTLVSSHQETQSGGLPPHTAQLIIGFKQRMFDWLRSEILSKVEITKPKRQKTYCTNNVVKVSKQLSNSLREMRLEDIVPGIGAKIYPAQNVCHN
jgi:hypothetical protein